MVAAHFCKQTQSNSKPQRPLALFNATSAPTLPAFMTRADASWGRVVVAIPAAGRAPAAMPVANRHLWDSW
jgi:hypothetical protein